MRDPTDYPPNGEALATVALRLSAVRCRGGGRESVGPARILPHDPDQTSPADCGTIALTVA